MSTDALAQLLEHPAIWRAGNAAQVETISTGFAQLDEGFPGGGWPRVGLVEILVPTLGVGELHLLMPLVAALTHKEGARWCTWVSPPHEPYAPALAAHGVALEKVLVVRTSESLWAMEQSLGVGACELALAWVESAPAKSMRRLQLAAERGRALGILFRHSRAATESSHAVLRVMAEAAANGLRLKLLKSRGGRRDWLHVSWSEVYAPGTA